MRLRASDLPRQPSTDSAPLRTALIVIRRRADFPRRASTGCERLRARQFVNYQADPRAYRECLSRACDRGSMPPQVPVPQRAAVQTTGSIAPRRALRACFSCRSGARGRAVQIFLF